MRNTEKLKGTIDGDILEWTGTRSGNDYGQTKQRFRVDSIFRGVKDGDTVVGYFEQTWRVGGQKRETYRGVVELHLQERR